MRHRVVISAYSEALWGHLERRPFRGTGTDGVWAAFWAPFPDDRPLIGGHALSMQSFVLAGVLCLLGGSVLAGCSSEDATGNDGMSGGSEPGAMPKDAGSSDVDTRHGAEDVDPASSKAGRPKQARTTTSDGVVHIHIESLGNSPGFDSHRIVVPRDARVEIEIKNNATLEVMVHNFVIVRKGAVDEVGAAAVEAGPEKGYIPDLDAVIAHSGFIAPGQVGTFEFDAPPPGEYAFICTYPGHYLLNRGVLVVKE